MIIRYYSRWIVFVRIGNTSNWSLHAASGASTLEISEIFFRGHSHRGNINAKGLTTDTGAVLPFKWEK